MATVAETPLRTILIGEIVISIIINIAFNMFFAWLLFPIDAPVNLWGDGGLAIDMIPATFMPALMMTLGITAGLRGRMRKGLRVSGGAAVSLPRMLAVRAVVIGLLALVAIALPLVLLLAALWSDPWTWGNLIAFKLGYSVLHALIVTPVVVLAAIHHDSPRSAASA